MQILGIAGSLRFGSANAVQNWKGERREYAFEPDR